MVEGTPASACLGDIGNDKGIKSMLLLSVIKKRFQLNLMTVFQIMTKIPSVNSQVVKASKASKGSKSSTVFVHIKAETDKAALMTRTVASREEHALEEQEPVTERKKE